jgi:tyrosyl-tRNA synthetase
MDVEFQMREIMKGVEEVLPDADALRALLAEGRPLRVKLGVDPTAKGLHLGHGVPMSKLRTFQDLGHLPIFLVGDFTARVGDPSDQKKTRPVLTRQEIDDFANSFVEQVSYFLDPAKTEIRYNSEWLSKLTVEDIVKLGQTTTVARLLERDDFSKRYKAGIPIHVHEFLYCLLVGYDSAALKCDIEVGGTEQKFNLLMGRPIQELFGQKPQIVMTMPVLEGVDGKEKMSKSLGNQISLSDSPKDKFGKVMSIPDTLIIKYFKLLTRRTADEIAKMEADMKVERVNPRDLKLDLAEDITARFHGADAAKDEREKFIRAFSSREKEAVAEDVRYGSEADIDVVSFLVGLGLASTRNEARRLVEQRGVRIDGTTVEGASHMLKPTDGMLITVGRRRVIRLRIARGRG